MERQYTIHVQVWKTHSQLMRIVNHFRWVKYYSTHDTQIQYTYDTPAANKKCLQLNECVYTVAAPKTLICFDLSLPEFYFYFYYYYYDTKTFSVYMCAVDYNYRFKAIELQSIFSIIVSMLWSANRLIQMPLVLAIASPLEFTVMRIRQSIVCEWMLLSLYRRLDRFVPCGKSSLSIYWKWIDRKFCVCRICLSTFIWYTIYNSIESVFYPCGKVLYTEYNV